MTPQERREYLGEAAMAAAAHLAATAPRFTEQDRAVLAAILRRDPVHAVEADQAVDDTDVA